MGSLREDLLGMYGRMPVLRPLPALDSARTATQDALGPRYQLLAPYNFNDQLGQAWTIDTGYVYDGASIPTLVGLTWAVTHSKFDPRVMRAALVHDYFCDTTPDNFTDEQAADLFLQMLLEDGVWRIRARAMARAVRWFGPHWN